MCLATWEGKQTEQQQKEEEEKKKGEEKKKKSNTIAVKLKDIKLNQFCF